MTITAGTRLGGYEVVAQIGAGGMGEVYQAHDTKLGRDVAIKVLPEAFAHDPQRLSRFQREAKLLASLNHPNIATIHGLEESSGTHYLVMELVPGETLRERVARDGALPVDEALGIARQIAEALEAAHEKSIIHRDLKPANVKVTPEGKVKVLDFGLAKAFAGEESGSDPSNSPTLSQAATLQGVILGTAAYMSPEQAKGKAVDKRTDIWAFGAVLYELLCGRAAFQGEDVTDILAAVVMKEPDWTHLPEAGPPAIRTLLRRCLRKDRRQRLSDASTLRIEIEDALAAPTTAESIATSRAANWRQAVPWAAAVVLSTVVGAAVWDLKPSPPAAQSPAHLVVALPPGDRISTVHVNVALSPDGSQLAYVAIRGGSQQLLLRALDSPEAKPIPGTEGAYNPFFSPDGQWIGFFAQGKMKKVSLGGGVPLTVCDSTESGGASWGSDDTIVFAPSARSGLWRVSAAGGQPQILTTPDPSKDEFSHRYPQILPGGKGVLFTAFSGLAWDESQVEVLRLDTKERRVLVRGGNTARFLAPGHLVYYRAGTLLAVPFDLARLEVKSAAPVTIAEGALQSGGTTGAIYSLSSDARTLAYVPAVGGSRQLEQRLVWVDRQGKAEPLPAPPRNYSASSLSLSADGQRVAVAITSGTEELWIYDLARATLTRLTSEQGGSLTPVWTPDGKRVAYRGNRAGAYNLYWRLADGSGSEERLTTSENTQWPFSWSPDGKLLAFIESAPATGYDIWILPLEGDRKPLPFLRTPFREYEPMFSPDGHWLAYQSNESGGTEVYVQPYPGPGRKWQVSTDGGSTPQWNPNGRELFYSNGDKRMVVDVTTSANFSASRPRVLYQGPYGVPSRDGQRFLAVQAVEPEQPPTQIHVMLNWSEELKRRVPAGK